MTLETSFERTLGMVQNHAQVIFYENLGSPYTQVVIGEKHFIPRVQCDVLKTLSSLRSDLGFSLLGKEGRQNQFTDAYAVDIDYERALQDEAYMRQLLQKDINAATIFAKHHEADVRAEVIEDPLLYDISGIIDQKYHELFKQRSQSSELIPEQEFELNYWLNLEKQILLGERSSFMVRKLFNLQEVQSAQLSVMVCGFAHTPCREEYTPFSVARMQKQLGINSIVAMSPLTWQVYEKTKANDPFDFFTSVDVHEVNPYFPN